MKHILPIVHHKLIGLLNNYLFPSSSNPSVCEYFLDWFIVNCILYFLGHTAPVLFVVRGIENQPCDCMHASSIACNWRSWSLSTFCQNAVSELLTVASRTKDWKRISAESSVMSHPQRPSRSRKWTELLFAVANHVHQTGQRAKLQQSSSHSSHSFVLLFFCVDWIILI